MPRSIEIPAGSEDEFVQAAKDADALYAKGRPITRKMIDGLQRCKIISLGSVGVDTVDVEAATAKAIPVTNCPDTFIEEVADHAMTLILATHRRLIEQDRMVRDGRWSEGRPALLKIPRLRGMTLGLIAFGHVARAVAERAKPFGLHIIAYDPFIEEMVMTERGVEPVSLPELLARADILSMHSPATESAQRMIREEHFRQMKKTAIYVSTGRGPTTDEAALIKALDEGLDRRGRARRARKGAAGRQQPAAAHGQRDPDRACRLGHGALRPGAAAAGRARIVAGALRQMADVVRQPVGAGQGRSEALAAGVDGARPEFVEPLDRHSEAPQRGEPGTHIPQCLCSWVPGSPTSVGPGMARPMAREKKRCPTTRSAIPIPASRSSTRALRHWCSATPRSSGSPAIAALPRGRCGSATAGFCCGATSPTTGS